MKNWEDFGKQIWDAAMNAHRFDGNKVTVPFSLDDGGMCRVTIEAPTYVETSSEIKEDGSIVRKFRLGVKLSDGTIRWEKV